MAIHEDEFLCTKNDQFTAAFLTNFRKSFAIGNEEIKCFRCLCLRIEQKHYKDDLTKFAIDANRKTNPSLSITASEKEILRSKIGQLLWICNQTLPTASFDVSNAT